MSIISRSFLALVSGAILYSAAPAFAQTYPARPIALIVPFAAGGPVDTTTRILAEKMKDLLGQPLVIENVGGAAGSLAGARVAKAAPDGYTIMTGIWGTHVANAAIYNLSYNVKTDFEPVVLLTWNPLLIVSSTKVPANTLPELTAWLKANSDKASQGTSGIGSVGQIAGVFFQKSTGTNFRFVPYRGLAPAMQDLMAGHIDLMFDTPGTSLPQVKAGSIRVYAVMGSERIPTAPDVPTVDEAGLPGLHIATWTGFFAPKGTPADIVAKLNAAAKTALADPQVQRRLAEVGQYLYPEARQSAEALAELQDQDIKKWWPIIKDANIKAE